QCCFRDKKIQACKSPARCKYHTENTPVTLLEIEKQTKSRVIKKQKQQSINAKIKTGSRVEVLNLTTFNRLVITIVDPREANRAQNKIPRTSMLGKNLLGHRVNEIIEYRFDGKVERYRILNIE
uniref:GreA/GreB family elongation factor n=1 Tax=Turicibacter sanguinis TaxID=154288 RepID=UPI00189E0BF6